jgi:hypothetical protein
MKEIQKNFLIAVGKKLGSEKLVATELMATLGISKSLAYSKIAGESLLTTLQIEVLCKKFGLNFSIIGTEKKADSEVSFMHLYHNSVSIKDYVKSLQNILETIITADDKKLSCATDDIPFFHLFKYPEITSFKLHFWNSRVHKNEQHRFDFAWPNKEVLQITNNIYELYQSIPSVEVWTQNSLMNTVAQIKYAVASKLLTDKGLGKTICQQLRHTLQDIERYAIHHKKGIDNNVPFDWYYHNIIGCISYLAETDGNKTVFLRFNTFNNMHGYNNPLCDEVKNWMDSLIKDSTSFNFEGSRFLETAYNNCDELEAMFS